MGTEREPPFYVGYLPTPPGLRMFLVAAAGLIVGAFVALGLTLAIGQDDPGPGDFQWAWGPQTVTGRLEARPYPVLHVSVGSEHIAAGRSLLLTGVGKKGLQSRAASLDGTLVRLTGIAIERGDIDALQVGDEVDAIEPVTGAAPRIISRDLGRWRLEGEICDGKCIAGAMRPGRGLAHRACANLCLVGGAPPVFVSAVAVDGRSFFLLSGPDGEPLPDSYLAVTAAFIAIEGAVEQRGDMFLFKVDLSTLEVL